MSDLTRNINALLDEINDIKSNTSITDDTIENIITDLNKITNNGESVKDVFTNIYYVNDINEDKRCAVS
jgi:predicted DNA-binding ArsR family transcriptional regulator